MAINRAPWNALVDDDGSNLVGTVWNKDKIKTVILDPADAAYAAKVIEGTWTPALSGSGGASGVTYASQVGHYSKIGRLVIVNFQIALSAKGTISGSVRLAGLPFTVQAGTYAAVNVFFNGLAVAKISVQVMTRAGEAQCDLLAIGAAGTSHNVDMVAADVGNFTAFAGNFSYLTAS